MLKVLNAGIYTSVQDKGRIGFAEFGVPVSGVMDGYSAALANGLLNNDLEDAVLEITLGNASFQFLNDTLICISGADFSPTINDIPIQLLRRIKVKKNDILSFNSFNYGVRCYLAVRGGFLTPKKLNSRSFYPNITKKIKLSTGDEVKYKPFNKKDFNNPYLTLRSNIALFKSDELYCYKGPEFYQLNSIQKKKIIDQRFTISKENSRMGYKLVEEITNDLPQILSSAVLPGTVQLTPSGKLIVLHRDCQVTGGYPRVLQLTENALNKLAQRTTGSRFYFKIKD